MIDSLNEDIEKKLSSLSARSSRYLQQPEKRSDPGMCVLWGPLTESNWQNGCSIWRKILSDTVWNNSDLCTSLIDVIGRHTVSVQIPSQNTSLVALIIVKFQ